MTEIRIEKKNASAWSVIVAILTALFIVALIAESANAIRNVRVSAEDQENQRVETNIDEFIAFASDSNFLNEPTGPATVYEGLDLLSQAYKEILSKQHAPSQDLLSRQEKLRDYLYSYAGSYAGLIEKAPEAADQEASPTLNEAIQVAGLLMTGIQKQYFPELELVAAAVHQAALSINQEAGWEMQEQQVKSFFIKAAEALGAIRENVHENLSHLNQE